MVPSVMISMLQYKSTHLPMSWWDSVLQKYQDKEPFDYSP